MLDSRTFGDSEAAIVLVNIINENYDYKNKKLLSLISKHLNQFNKILIELDKIDVNVAISIANSIYPNFKQSALNIPGKYGTYTANVLTAKKRVWAASKNAQMPKKKRNKII